MIIPELNLPNNNNSKNYHVFRFFKSKLPLLDREKKNYVQVGQALDILKYTGLSHETVKKILNNLKLTSNSSFNKDKGSLDYT